MNKVQLYNEILTLLPLSRTNEDFRDDLHNAMQRYFDITNESDTEIKNEIDNWSATIDKVHSFAKGIEKCVDFYFEGLHSDAFLFLKKHLLGDGQNNGVLDFIDLHTISKGTSLYRGRLFDHKRQRTYKDMFHIPLNKRGIVKTHRYSAPGYPCLYLGATVYACWEELQRPTFNDLMLSAFRTTRDIQLFDIRRPSVNDFNADKLISTLIRLPLIIASSFKVSDNAKDDDFKPEYIIPQLLIELIIRKNRIEEDATMTLI